MVIDVTMIVGMNDPNRGPVELDPIPANNTATVDTLIALFVDGFESGDLTAWD